jgi:hypothetical protein
MSDEAIIQAVEQTVGQRPRSVQRLTGGANNVVARVELQSEPLLAKVYFSHPRDLRDRLGAEFNVLSFLWNNGVRCVPRPVAMNQQYHLGLYEFIHGEKPAAGEVRADDVRQLATLLSTMWALRDRPGADILPKASEAEFSLQAYHDHVAARLVRMETALASDSVPASVRELLRLQARPAWETIGRFLESRSADYGIDVTSEIPRHLRTLSPADHGFHNTLRTSEGRLVFLDFEYAGWDQPAQVLANACLQPEIPLPSEFRKTFITEMLEQLREDPQLLLRLRLLYPMLSLKWSLIMLNEFLPVSGERRSFAGTNAESRRALQLRKSETQVQTALAAAREGFFLDDLIDEFR